MIPLRGSWFKRILTHLKLSIAADLFFIPCPKQAVLVPCPPFNPAVCSLFASCSLVSLNTEYSLEFEYYSGSSQKN